jgi:integrase
MAYGDGSLFKNDRGTWTMFATIDGRRYKRTGKDKTAVRAKVAEVRRQIAAGEYEAPTAKRDRQRVAGTTVAAAVEEWLAGDMPARELAPSTADRHRYSGAHVVRLLGPIRIVDLSVRDVEGAFVKLANEGQSRASIVKVATTLSLVLRSAVRRGDLTRNVVTDAVIPASAPRTAARRSLAPDDARKLLGALRREPNGLAYALGLRLGLRPGEAWALHWRDLEAGTVNVTRGIQRSGGRSSISDDLKTAASKRTIALPPDLAAWVEEHRSTQRLERIAATGWVDDRLVFTGPTGNLVDPALARSRLVDICHRAGVDPIRPNELRHSCASLLSDEGVPNELIADLLGHTTTRMVDQTYRHRLRPVVDVAANATWAAGKS